MLGAAEIFVIFFVTLGPLKVLGPFAQRTRDLPAAMVQQVAVRAFLIATAAIVVGGFLGRTMLAKWQITIPSMAIATGIIFLLVALRQLLEQYEPPQGPRHVASGRTPDRGTAVSDLGDGHGTPARVSDRADTIRHSRGHCVPCRKRGHRCAP